MYSNNITRFFKQITFLSCMLALSGMLYAANNTQSNLKSLLNNIKTMQADFKQSVYSENNKLLQSYNGKMEFKKPNLFRWEVLKPDQTLLVTNGKKLWNYDVGLEQVTVQQYSDNKEITPLSFILDDTNKLTQNFSIEQLSNTCYKLTPKLENSNFVNVEVCFKNKLISSVNIFDHLGQNSKFEFSKVKNNNNIADKRFSFKPPAGVDVVGEE